VAYQLVAPSDISHFGVLRFWQIVQGAEMLGWFKRYESYMGKAVQHFEANPGDLRDPKFNFEAKHLGYKDGSRAWNYINESLAHYGLDITQMARDATNRRATDPTSPIISKEQYRALALQAQNEVTMTAGIGTRMPSPPLSRGVRGSSPAPGSGRFPT
jgi:hypothetical protein